MAYGAGAIVDRLRLRAVLTALFCALFILPAPLSPLNPAPLLNAEKNGKEADEKETETASDVVGVSQSLNRRLSYRTPANSLRDPARAESHHSTVCTSSESPARPDPFGNGLGTRLRC